MGWEAVWRPNTCFWGPNWCTKVGGGGYCSFSVLRYFFDLKNVLKLKILLLPSSILASKVIMVHETAGDGLSSAAWGR